IPRATLRLRTVPAVTTFGESWQGDSARTVVPSASLFCGLLIALDRDQGG
ncbi:hypothetical protein THAOC_07031, partial [Thalassiosira oceanica]